MPIASAESAMIRCIVHGSPTLDEAVDALLCELLAGVGPSRRATDGLTLWFERLGHDRAEGAGVVFLIDDQSTEPVRFEFVLDSERARCKSGRVWFGDRGSPLERDKLAKRILADPNVEFDWRERFRRDTNGWQRETDRRR